MKIRIAMLNHKTYDVETVLEQDYQGMLEMMSNPNGRIRIGPKGGEIIIPVRNIESIQIIG